MALHKTLGAALVLSTMSNTCQVDQALPPSIPTVTPTFDPTVQQGLFCEAKLSMMIDTSGSMAPRFDEVQLALDTLVAALPEDLWQLSIDSFSTDTQTHLEPIILTDSGNPSSREQAIDALYGLVVGGGTIITEALLRGETVLAGEAYDDRPDDARPRILVVVSDGGFFDPMGATIHAQAMQTAFEPPIEIITLGFDLLPDEADAMRAIASDRPDGTPAYYDVADDAQSILDALEDAARDFCGPVLLEIDGAPVTSVGGHTTGEVRARSNPTWGYGSSTIVVEGRALMDTPAGLAPWADVQSGMFSIEMVFDPAADTITRFNPATQDWDVLGTASAGVSAKWDLYAMAHTAGAQGSSKLEVTASEQSTDASGAIAWRRRATASTEGATYPLTYEARLSPDAPGLEWSLDPTTGDLSGFLAIDSDASVTGGSVTVCLDIFAPLGEISWTEPRPIQCTDLDVRDPWWAPWFAPGKATHDTWDIPYGSGQTSLLPFRFTLQPPGPASDHDIVSIKTLVQGMGHTRQASAQVIIDLDSGDVMPL
jgi:hypothetical protein